MATIKKNLKFSYDNEISYSKKIKELKQKLEELNRLQGLANMLQKNIDSIPKSFLTIRDNLDNVATTIKDDSMEVSQRIQLLSEQYKQLGIIICKKYTMIANNINATVKIEKQAITDSITNLNILRNRQEAMKSVQRKIIDRL